MRSFRLSALLMGLFLTLLPARAEHTILCGGPALRKWENLRIERDRHDRWWANFVRASTLRMDQIHATYGPEAPITWIVYRPGYAMRSHEDAQPYIEWITENAVKRGVKLVWVNSGQEAILALNKPRTPILTFDYFGHSNRYCFLLDYGSEIMAASTAWIHEKDLEQINRKAFNSEALCISWGCHTGASMSRFWKAATGLTLIGCTGKTDYTVISEGCLPINSSGRWVR